MFSHAIEGDQNVYVLSRRRKVSLETVVLVAGAPVQLQRTLNALPSSQRGREPVLHLYGAVFGDPSYVSK